MCYSWRYCYRFNTQPSRIISGNFLWFRSSLNNLFPQSCYIQLYSITTTQCLNTEMTKHWSFTALIAGIFLRRCDLSANRKRCIQHHILTEKILTTTTKNRYTMPTGMVRSRSIIYCLNSSIT